MMRNSVLPTWELGFYGSCLIAGIVFTTYRVHDIGNYLSPILEEHLSDGWSFIGRQKDDSDGEWKNWLILILSTLYKWVPIHYVGAKIVSSIYIPALPFWYLTITGLCVIQNFGWYIFMIFLFQPAIFCLILLDIRSRLLIWLLCYGCCYFFTEYTGIASYEGTAYQLRIVTCAIMWIYLRCISFSMHIIENNNFTLSTVIAFLGYVFYLPTFFLGPILLFDEFFYKMFHKRKRRTLCIVSVLHLILQNLRYFFWMWFTELLLHFLYVNALPQSVIIFERIGIERFWLLCGMAFHMGLFFFLKYTVVYGLAITWAKAEEYDTPNAPRCLIGIFLYSDIWRYFDHGLYLFIKKHIYQPSVEFTSSRTVWMKMCIKFICFIFVYVWHGLQFPILMWSVLNYCSILSEMVFRQISKTEQIRRMKKIIGPSNERRLIGLIWPPLYVLSTISNFYFLAGASVSETYFSYLFFHITRWELIYLWLSMYILGQILMEIKAHQATKEIGRRRKTE